MPSYLYRRRIQCAGPVRNGVRQAIISALPRCFALSGPVIKDKTFYYAALEQEHNRGQIGSDIDPTVASTINAFLATGAFPGLATRQITTAFSPIARAETEAAGKLDHQLTRNTALMLRYTFTNNKESGDAFNTTASSTRVRGQQLHERQRPFGIAHNCPRLGSR